MESLRRRKAVAGRRFRRRKAAADPRKTQVRQRAAIRHMVRRIVRPGSPTTPPPPSDSPSRMVRPCSPAPRRCARQQKIYRKTIIFSCYSNFFGYICLRNFPKTPNIRKNGFAHSRTRHQTLRRTYGTRRRIALDSQRIGLRAARTQRRRQDDAHPHHQLHHGPRHGPRAARRARNRPRGCPPHRLPARGAGSLQEDEGRRAGRLLRPPEGTFAPRSRRTAQKVVRQVRHRRVVGQEDRGALEGHGPEGAVHRHGAARTRAADLRRTLLGLRATREPR